MTDINELRPAVEVAGLNAISVQEVLELIDRLELAESKKDAYKEAFEISENTTRDLTEKVIPNIRNQLEAAEKDIALKEKIIDSLGSTLNAVADTRDALRAELETERMRLTACGVVALSNTPDSAKWARDIRPEYWSASCSDVARMVDENIKLRARIEAAERDNTLKEMLIDRLALELNSTSLKHDTLRAKIEAMEKQEPSMWANSSNINSSRINKERGGRGDQHTCSETKTAYHDAPLYALPGAKGEEK